MRFFALAIGAALAMITNATAWAQSPGGSPPDDSSAYSVIVVTNAPEQPADAALVAAMRAHPDLKRIYETVKFFKFPANDRLFLDRYAATLRPTALPAVALIRSDGGILYQACGPEIPAPDALARRLVEIATADRIANPRPVAGPINTPAPNPTPPGGFPYRGEMGSGVAVQWPGVSVQWPGGSVTTTPPTARAPRFIDGILSPIIAPQIEIPAEVGYAALVAVVVAVGLGGLFVFGVAILAALLVFRD
jgi:hypothetical protein